MIRVGDLSTTNKTLQNPTNLIFYNFGFLLSARARARVPFMAKSGNLRQKEEVKTVSYLLN